MLLGEGNEFPDRARRIRFIRFDPGDIQTGDSPAFEQGQMSGERPAAELRRKKTGVIPELFEPQDQLLVARKEFGIGGIGRPSRIEQFCESRRCL